MSEYGSWAQWRERTDKASKAGGWFLAVDGDDSGALEDEWEARHLKHRPDSVAMEGEPHAREIETAIAERRAD